MSHNCMPRTDSKEASQVDIDALRQLDDRSVVELVVRELLDRPTVRAEVRRIVERDVLTGTLDDPALADVIGHALAQRLTPQQGEPT